MSSPHALPVHYFELSPLLLKNGLNLAAFTNRSPKDQKHAKMRKHEESPAHVAHASDPFRVDYERIIRSPAYLRLDRIWQLSPHGRHGSKNRQTHTQDTIMIAENLCRALKLGQESEDLARAICAAHDIGHPPFAHEGERAIKAVLSEYGIDWNHDQVALQLLTEWPAIPGRIPGINPTNAVMEGVGKRFWRYARPNVPPKPPYLQPLSLLPESMRNEEGYKAIHAHDLPCIEGQVAAAADWIAHTASDVADGLKEQRMTIEEVDAHFPGVLAYYKENLQQLRQVARAQHHGYSETEGIQTALIESVASYMRDVLVCNVLHHAQKRLIQLKHAEIEDAEEVRDASVPVVMFDEAMMERVRGFKKSLMQQKVYPALMAEIAKQSPDEKMQPQAMVEEMLRDFIAGAKIEFKTGTEISPMSNDWRLRRAKLLHDVEGAEEGPAKQAAQKKLALAGVEYLVRQVGDKDVLRYHAAKHAVQQKLHAKETDWTGLVAPQHHGNSNSHALDLQKIIQNGEKSGIEQYAARQHEAGDGGSSQML